MLAVKKHIKQLGFTLIELMIVIAIIALLAAAGLASYSNSQKAARDSKRVQDVKTIQAALEQFQVQAGVYPGTGAGAGGGGYTAGTFTPPGGSAINMTSFYATGIPTPPTGGAAIAGGPPLTPYEYTTDIANSATKYCICTALEATKYGNASANAAGACTFTTVAANINRYCAANQQSP